MKSNAWALLKSFMAFDVCSCVLQYILDYGKTATIRTEEDNDPMRRVIEKMGFVPVGE